MLKTFSLHKKVRRKMYFSRYSLRYILLKSMIVFESKIIKAAQKPIYVIYYIT